MADVKRRFYNTDQSEAGGVNAKGFTKAVFFQTVAALAAGDEVDPGMVDLVSAAVAYELDGISNRASAAGTGEKKDPLQSEYAVALANAIVPLVTAEPQTAKALIDLATSKGKLSPKGTPFAAPWVSRVLNANDAVEAVKVIVDHVDAKGLKSQKEVTAYVVA